MMADSLAFELASIVKEAGGEIVGRTRLQKMMYFLSVTGMSHEFSFEFKHYGPFSEDLSYAIREARIAGLVKEEENIANWGGFYSVYRLLDEEVPERAERAAFVREINGADSVQLELAATALFLARCGIEMPWKETARRKPEKAKSHLKDSMALYEQLRHVPGIKGRLPAL